MRTMAKQIKATKLDVLKYIKSEGLVEVWQLRDHFGYSEMTVYNKLSRLKKQGLVINMTEGKWELTEEGFRRLRFYGRE